MSTNEDKLSIDELEPWGEWIVTRRDHQTEETETGLIIPEKYRDRPLACTVVRAGPSVEWLSEGSRILIGRWDGTDIKLNDGTWACLVRSSEIVCLIGSASDAAETATLPGGDPPAKPSAIPVISTPTKRL